MAYEEHDPHSKRIFDANDWRSYTVTQEHVARSRRGYFANISYLDEKIGELFQILEDSRQEAIVVFVSDHGDMLGERGLWFKMSMFEGSARVPLMIAAPGIEPGRVETPVSTLDVGPTLAELAGLDVSGIADWTQGTSLLPIAQGGTRASVPIEYAAEASIAPIVALRDAQYKYVRCAADPDQLFDLHADPHELVNLADDPVHGEALAKLSKEADELWSLSQFDLDVRASQARRLVVYDALRKGGYYPWDFQPLQKASERFMRNHMDLNDLEERQRFPRGE
jgi:choline-sulfatase